MKKDFTKGFLVGLLFMLAISASAFAIHVILDDRRTDNNKNKTGMLATPNLAEVDIDNSAKDKFDTELINKAEAIKKLIDYYYYEDVTEEELLDGMFSGMLASLGDVYSTYYTKEEYEKTIESSSGIYCGIGSVVSQNMQTGIMTIVKPYVDGPAYKAGLLPGDILYMVDGEDITALDLTEVVSRIKGEPGTKVVLSVYREGEEDYIDIEITRAQITIQTIEYEMLEDDIGYIYISEFDEITVEQFRKAIDDLEDKGMKGLVIDLRDNPGGLYTSVVSMLDRLLPEGLIVYTEDKYGHRSESLSTAEEEFKLPMAVIINGQSASASEIFAGAIQDYGTGTIVGTQSFGKGIVQSIIPAYIDGSAVKLTVYHYFTPKGRRLHGEGVTPDIKVELDEELKQKVVIEHEEDNQLQKAIECVTDKINDK